MLRRFIAFIDGLGEYLSPYYVLHQRRVFRFSRIWIVIPTFYVLIAVLALVGMAFSDHVEIGIREFSAMAEFMTPMMMFWLVWGIICGQMGLWLNYYIMKKADPLMLVTPLSNREVYFGFRQIEILSFANFFFSLTPFLALLYYGNLISLQWATLYPLLLWLLSLTIGGITFSVSLASRNIFQAVALAILWILFAVATFVFAFGGTYMFMLYRFGLAPPLVYSILGPIDMSPYWLPVACTAIVLYNLAAWTLCGYNLEESRSFFQKLGVSLGVYFGITLLLAGLWIGLWFLFR